MKTRILIAAALMACASAFAASKASPERKQTELEAAVAKAASAPNADLTKIQCGNLVYAGNKSSVCFADKFLSDVARETNVNVGKNFVPVRLDANEVFNFPFCVWSGEDAFSLTVKDRENLRRYLLGGGFILSSPGCSDANWDERWSVCSDKCWRMLGFQWLFAGRVVVCRGVSFGCCWEDYWQDAIRRCLLRPNH